MVACIFKKHIDHFLIQYTSVRSPQMPFYTLFVVAAVRIILGLKGLHG